MEGRIGGFGIPFDAGFKVGYLPLNLDTFSFNYLLIGGDFRYAVLQDRAMIPALSVGFGVNWLSGGVGFGLKDTDFSFDSSKNLSINKPNIDLSWSTLCFELKAQVSRSFILFTPYAGLGFTYAMTTVEYGVKADSITGNLSEAGKTYNIAINGRGFSASRDFNGFGMRFFGGLAFNIAMIRLNISLMAGTGNNFNFGTMNFGGSFGIRFQM